MSDKNTFYGPIKKTLTHTHLIILTKIRMVINEEIQIIAVIVWAMEIIFGVIDGNY